MASASVSPDPMNAKELIDLVKDEISKTNDPKAKIIIEKLDSIQIDFPSVRNMVKPEQFKIIQKYYRELIILLVKNKKRLDEEVLSKSDQLIEDIKIITSHFLNSAVNRSPTSLPAELKQITSRLTSLQTAHSSALASNDSASTPEIIERLKTVMAQVDIYQDWNFNDIKRPTL